MSETYDAYGSYRKQSFVFHYIVCLNPFQYNYSSFSWSVSEQSDATATMDSPPFRSYADGFGSSWRQRELFFLVDVRA